jgi:hypothetical protein
MKIFTSLAVCLFLLLFLGSGCGQDGDDGAPEESFGGSPAPSAEEAASRYVKAELGWERIRLLDLTYADTPEAEDAGPVRVRVIRCAESDWDDTYPDVSCDPSPDDRAYPAALVTVERGGANEPGWMVTDLERVSVHQPPPVAIEDVQVFVRAFLEARIQGSGAEEYLAPRAREQLPNPLYNPRSDPAYERFKVLFIDGPLWPFASWEVGIRMSTEQRSAGDATSFTETLAIGPRADVTPAGARLFVLGGRQGHTGP